MRAITCVSELRNESALGGWLRQIANHVCVDMIRRQRVRRTDSMDMQTVPGDGGSHSVCDKDQQEHLMSLINALPETHREIVLLHYYEDMTYAEIAQWLGIARSTVSERLNKARQMLRSGLATTRSTP